MCSSQTLHSHVTSVSCLLINFMHPEVQLLLWGALCPSTEASTRAVPPDVISKTLVLTFPWRYISPFLPFRSLSFPSPPPLEQLQRLFWILNPAFIPAHSWNNETNDAHSLLLVMPEQTRWPRRASSLHVGYLRKEGDLLVKFFLLFFFANSFYVQFCLSYWQTKGLFMNAHARTLVMNSRATACGSWEVIFSKCMGPKYPFQTGMTASCTIIVSTL